MTTINNFFVTRPALTAGILNHLWQSSIVGLVILGLLLLGGQLSARTRRVLAWLALAKFALPVAALVSLAGPLAHLFGGGMKIDRLQLPALLLPVMPPASGWTTPAVSGGFVAREFWPVAAGLWAAGLVCLIGFWAFRVRQLRRQLLATAAPLTGALAHSVQVAARRMGGSAPPRCLSVETGYGPGVLGVLAPVVLLPRGIETTLFPQELEAILIHEFVHVRRRDPSSNFLQLLLVSAFWFNPVIWLLQRRLKIETEKSCDERVLAITADPDTYAAGIAKTVRFSLGLPQIGFASAAMPPVAARLKEILSRTRRPERRTLRLASLGAGVTLLAFSGYAGSIDSSPAAASAVAAPAPAMVTPDASIYPVSELDQQPIATYQPRPLYPFEMKQQGLSGQVVVEYVLGTDGIVTGAFAVSSTQRGFEASAIQAVSRWRFRAGRKDGVAVKTRMQVPIVFTLNQEGVIPAKNPIARPSPAPLAPVVPAAMAPAIAMPTASSNVPPAPATAQAIAAVAPAPPTPALPAARAQVVVLARDRDLVAPPVKPVAPPVVAQSAPIPSGPQLYQPRDLDEQPKPTKQPRPVYPFDMKNRGISGQVLVEFLVDSNGMVQNAHALSSTQRTFENSAVFAVSKWQFNPGRKGGVVVNTLMQVPIIFSLNHGG